MFKSKSYRKLLSSKKGKDITGNAQAFEEKLLKKDLLIKKLLKWIAVTGVTFGLLGIIAVIVMLPLKRIDTRIFMVDKLTGRQEEVVSVKGGDLTQNQAMGRFFVKKYIEWREGYNYFRLQMDYDAVMLYSNDAVANEYNQLFKGANRPQDVYHKGEQTAKVDVLSIIISDSSNPSDPDKLAMVRFKKNIRDVTSGSDRVEYGNARLTYRITPPNKEKGTDVDDNPLGFVVTSYQAEKENRG